MSTRRRISARLFRALCVSDYEWQPGNEARSDAWYRESAERFLSRFDPPLRVAGRRILDVGTGNGLLCGMLAERGAERVVGIDIQPFGDDHDRLRADFGAAADRVELIETAGDFAELGGERFDLVISKDAMEHYDDPEGFVAAMVELVAPGGELAIGFGPLWKSFNGAHIPFMTRVPWVHLMFSDDVILAERRRFRPQEEATAWHEILGGLNQMTLARFERIMAATGLRQVGLTTNAGTHPAVRAMDVVARVPPLREYFTNNVFGVWRRPA